jgi:hypothetical protein
VFAGQRGRTANRFFTRANVRAALNSSIKIGAILRGGSVDASLVEWLEHSGKKYCELCKHPFVFQSVFTDDMPAHIPWYIVVKRGVALMGQNVLDFLRLALVAALWTVLGRICGCNRVDGDQFRTSSA